MITFHSKKPSVAILSTFHQPCGLATYAEDIVKELRLQGIEMMVLAEQTQETTILESPFVFRCWERDHASADQMLEILERHQIQILHVNHGGIFKVRGWLLPFLELVEKAHIKIVITFHSTENQEEEFVRLTRLSEKVLVHFPENLLQLTAIGVPAQRVEVVPLGFHPAVETDLHSCKQEIGWDLRQPVVTTFGFIEPHKGILEVIEAFPILHQKLNARLVIAGIPHPNNPESHTYLEKCKAIAKQLNLANCVSFENHYWSESDLMRILRASDVIVMNYQSQRFEASAATAYALSSGRPVVSSSAPAFSGFPPVTFKTTRAWPLAVAIAHVLCNPNVAFVLRQNIKAYEKTASWHVVGHRIQQIYQNCLSTMPILN